MPSTLYQRHDLCNCTSFWNHFRPPFLGVYGRVAPGKSRSRLTLAPKRSLLRTTNAPKRPLLGITTVPKRPLLAKRVNSRLIKIRHRVSPQLTLDQTISNVCFSFLTRSNSILVEPPVTSISIYTNLPLSRSDSTSITSSEIGLLVPKSSSHVLCVHAGLTIFDSSFRRHARHSACDLGGIFDRSPWLRRVIWLCISSHELPPLRLCFTHRLSSTTHADGQRSSSNLTAPFTDSQHQLDLSRFLDWESRTRLDHARS